MFERFRQRSYELEHLDKGDYTPEEYEGCIVELQRVNEWLGDVQALRNSLLKEIERIDLKSFSVLDVGAGSGERLRVTAESPHEKEPEALLVGLELNAAPARAILVESRQFRDISALRSHALNL